MRGWSCVRNRGANLCDLLMPKSNGFEVCAPFAKNCNQPRSSWSQAAIMGSIEPAPLKQAQMNIAQTDHVELLSSTIDGSCRKSRAVPNQNLYRNVSRCCANKAVGVRVQFQSLERASPLRRKHQLCGSARDGEIIILDAGTDSSARSGFGQRIRTSLDEVDSFDLTHSLGSYPGTAFLFSGVQSEKSHPVLGYEGARAGLAKIWPVKWRHRFFPVSLRQLPSHWRLRN